jgi:hypothetical protein
VILQILIEAGFSPRSEGKSSPLTIRLINPWEGAFLSRHYHFMKTKILLVICALMVGFGGFTPVKASPDNSVQVVGDLALVRPGCFVVTILGSAIFVLALPIAAASGSVKETANTLVVHPAEATFTRPLGDFSTLN